MTDREPEAGSCYREEQTRAWLSWLARGMQKHGQTVFLLEQLQPSWLGSHRQQLAYAVASRLAGSLLFGLACGVIWLASEPEWMTFALLFTTIGGVLAGLIDFVRLPDRHRTRTLVEAALTVLVFTLAGLAALIASLFVVLSVGALAGVVVDDSSATWLLLLAPLFGLVWGVGARRRSLTGDVRTVEVLTWSWRHAGLRAVRAGVTGLAALILILYLRVPWNEFRGVHVGEYANNKKILAWCTLIIFLVLLSTVFGGLRARAREMPTDPNQGIRLSIRSSLWAAVSGPVVAFVLLQAIVVVKYAFDLPPRDPAAADPRAILQSVATFALMGVAAGIVAARHYGGLAALQHYTLRFILWRRGDMPWRYARFLDHAAGELRFLQKVGGGYMFVHRYLLEHFAAMEETKAA